MKLLIENELTKRKLESDNIKMKQKLNHIDFEIENDLRNCFIEKPKFDYEFETYENYVNRNS